MIEFNGVKKKKNSKIEWKRVKWSGNIEHNRVKQCKIK